MTRHRSRSPRHQLILKVDYDHASGFSSDYLRNLSDGGLLLSSELRIGEVVQLRISFPGPVGAIEVDAVCRWSQPECQGEGALSGLEFMNVSDEARAKLAAVLESSDDPPPYEEPIRVCLFERDRFLQEIYGQEIRNWAELEGAALELVIAEDVDRWIAVNRDRTVAINVVDVDGLTPATPAALLARFRSEVSGTPSIIVLGASDPIRAPGSEPDEHLLLLPKPLAFGLLMSTIRRLSSVRER